jgi:hypothetical protein
MRSAAHLGIHHRTNSSLALARLHSLASLAPLRFVADLLSCVPLLLDIDLVTLKKIAKCFSILR